MPPLPKAPQTPLAPLLETLIAQGKKAQATLDKLAADEGTLEVHLLDPPRDALAKHWQQLLAGNFTDQHSPGNAFSTAPENAIIVKSGAGLLQGFTATTDSVADQFIQVHDLSGSEPPPDGAVPVCVFGFAAGSTLGLSWPFPGRFFTQGIVIVNSSTDFIYTAGAADTMFDVQYL